jgi:hypothetical protein
MARLDDKLPEHAIAARPMRKLLFLSDCYLRDSLWSPFHQSMMACLAAAFDQVLAVRVNSFYREEGGQPFSESEHDRLVLSIREFEPDAVFSINRAGLTPAVIAAAGRDRPVISLFIDYFDRFAEAVHRYGPRDIVWLLGTPRMGQRFRERFGDRVRAEQVIVTHWCSDHFVFHPAKAPPIADIVFVGTPFPSHPFENILDSLRGDPANRALFLAVYERHKREYVGDWSAALAAQGFDFDRLTDPAASWFGNGQYLQAAACDQITAETRVRFLSALAGLSLHIYGSPTLQWVRNISLVNSDLFRHYQFREVADPGELAGLYNGSKIGINLQHDNARGQGLSFRAYDVMACKSLLASHVDGVTALSELGFIEGTDFISFADPTELRRKCEYYLAHESERAALGESAYAKLRAKHTLAHRLAEVFARGGDADAGARFSELARQERLPADAQSRIRYLPDRLPPAAPPDDPVGRHIRALAAEIADMRASWALRIGCGVVAPLRLLRRMLTRVG